MLAALLAAVALAVLGGSAANDDATNARRTGSAGVSITLPKGWHAIPLRRGEKLAKISSGA